MINLCLRSKGKLNVICSVVNFDCTFFSRLDRIMHLMKIAILISLVMNENGKEGDESFMYS